MLDNFKKRFFAYYLVVVIIQSLIFIFNTEYGNASEELLFDRVGISISEFRSESPRKNQPQPHAFHSRTGIPQPLKALGRPLHPAACTHAQKSLFWKVLPLLRARLSVP